MAESTNSATCLYISDNGDLYSVSLFRVYAPTGCIDIHAWCMQIYVYVFLIPHHPSSHCQKKENLIHQRNNQKPENQQALLQHPFCCKQHLPYETLMLFPVVVHQECFEQESQASCHLPHHYHHCGWSSLLHPSWHLGRVRRKHHCLKGWRLTDGPMTTWSTRNAESSRNQ